eukprot:CAMPEP_0116097466 /NCGR_PEP_ID=MMETSP0327-20121206/10722_1 /TAXON_ID=44447 /ORGANISM="Pseudo-nitzschia delicatissima, Strain B596" /LENGTH=665 /DNA_ID=CAMNT_0003589223 /DNA_START=204 /DNA_END=2201 /DNA_ORIENTATION=+
MEELQDAIEDAQYVNAIATQVEGPRPVLSWDIPDEEQMEAWEAKKAQEADPNGPEVFGIDWCLKSAIGFFLFSEFLKVTCEDYLRINFIEDVIDWRRMRGQQRLERAKRIVQKWLTPVPVDKVTGQRIYPKKKEIVSFDIIRDVPQLDLSEDELREFYANNRVLPFDPLSMPTRNCIRISGPVLDEIQIDISGVEQEHDTVDAPTASKLESTELTAATRNLPNRRSIKEKYSTMVQLTEKLKVGEPSILEGLFKKVDVLVIESLKRQYWEQFTASTQFTRLKNFMWFFDRPVLVEDFFSMRVLGRGGFGSVTACKKGTSGKLYAMKVMNKKRIKLKKSEVLAINEQRALAAVESPFVVNLKYSFHSKENIYLILDLMTGGDLSYHLQQKGSFPTKESRYYAARIMLGLQALHDKGYVYRDLKPENLLLAEDGRVKITDLGLATKITPTLHGAAGTRGYWAPEMLRRDSRGKRMPYGHTVDWFSFGCCLAEFISGANPFRSQAALKFGLEAGEETKEKAIDHATLEMDPEFPASMFDEDAADLCKRLLDKNEHKRLGSQGCEQIMAHPWFKSSNWEAIISDRKMPPWVPPKDVNAASQSEIGTFDEDKKIQECVIDEKDEKFYADWDWTNPNAYAAEVIEFLIYERETGKPLLPLDDNTSCCCSVM